MSYISRKQLEWLGEPIGDPRDNVRGKNRQYYGGGKGDSEAPDYTAVAKASEKAAEIGAELGRKQLEEAKRQYDLNMQVAQPVVAAQLGLMNQQQVQGDDYFNYNKDYSRPVEKSLYYDAMGFTPEEIAQIEASRSQESTTFKTNQEAEQAAAKVKYESEYAAADAKSIQGAVSGKDIPKTAITKLVTTQQPVDPRYLRDYGIASSILPRFNLQKPAPDSTPAPTYNDDSYYIKQPDGSYKIVTRPTKTSDQTDSSYTAMETPETDALVSQLSALASERLKATDKAERDAIDAKSNALAQRLGETNRQVYDRYKADIDAESDMAVADSRKGFTDQLNTTIRQGLRYGMSPAKIAAGVNSQGTAQATVQAAAANGTRKAATETMYGRGVNSAGQTLTGATNLRSNRIQDESIRTAKKLDTAGLYRGLTGASQGAYGLSVNAGNSAVNNKMQPSGQLLNANQGAASTILQGSQQQISGLTGIVNSQTSLANKDDGSAGIWGALGTVGGAVVAGAF